ncbi:MAG: recombination protein RecR [Phycisphaeraceae bacterium]|nr:MAG: recombination protein RecR [Phycisphaeraceae bacterium]
MPDLSANQDSRNRGPRSAAPRPGGSAYPGPVERLIVELGRLPGIGRRSAERLAFHLLKASTDEAMGLARAVEDLKKTVRHCSVCYNLTDEDPCVICADARRDRSKVLVVEQPRDLIAIEQTGMYKGLYHVLMGRLSPLDGVEPDDLTISALLARITDPTKNAGGEAVGEVILGLNPTLEGDGTAMYLHDELASRGVGVTRLARGLPAGGSLEFANKAVLADAIEGRQRM